MRVPVYLVCAALIAAVRGDEKASEFSQGYQRLQPLDLTADRETVAYLLPKLAAKYRPSQDWNGVTDPRFYMLTDMESNDVDYQDPSVLENRSKRQGLNPSPSLSIVNSLDVLRNRLLLEIARKKQMEGMNRNRNYLTSVGKRSSHGHRNVLRYDNSL